MFFLRLSLFRFSVCLLSLVALLLRFGFFFLKRNFNPEKQGALTLQAAEGKARVYPYRRQNMFLEQAKHVVRCFERGEQPLVTGTDGIEALKIAAAVLKSGKSRQTVRIR